jgi:hypothetical protein
LISLVEAAVEAMLRTGVQSQLEGIRTALGQLQTASEDMKSVETKSVLPPPRACKPLQSFLLQSRGGVDDFATISGVARADD